MKIILLHHSTGGIIWNPAKPSKAVRAIGKISEPLAQALSKKPHLPALFEEYRKTHNKNYLIEEKVFPKTSPYGWHNYPYDYYNIWVKHAGNKPYMEEPTLEMLTKEYQVIIFKHCYPVCNIQADGDTADIDSDQKTLANYKLQYDALKKKLHSFPDTKFILFTGAVQVKQNMREDEAKRAKQFFEWVSGEWDESGDNIFLWDLYSLQTEGGLYFKAGYSVSDSDSHPNPKFGRRVGNLLFNRIIDVIENNGEDTSLTGERIE